MRGYVHAMGNVEPGQTNVVIEVVVELVVKIAVKVFRGELEAALEEEIVWMH